MDNNDTFAKLERFIEKQYGKSWKDMEFLERLKISEDIEWDILGKRHLSEKERKIWEVVNFIIYGPMYNWSEESIKEGAIRRMNEAGLK